MGCCSSSTQCLRHDDVLKRRAELSQELVSLRGELASSTTACEQLQREKDELHAVFQGALQKLQEEHRLELSALEQQLQALYSAEWEKVHEAYQEEADRCRSQMQQQVNDLRSKHNTLRKELEASHEEKIDCVKLQYETSLEELRKTNEQNILTLQETLKETKTLFSNQIQELKKKNTALCKKINNEEEKRKMLEEKSEGSHTLYLEQELKSLKVVLDMKNQHLHEQERKLIQMEKLMERNVQLDECFRKVQQENEDLKARMDKHAALSRQLCTEQAVLQESLQKESKVNKRLSMENEELLWKLYSGDLNSSQKLSPSSAAMPQSPHSSVIFSSCPDSAR